MIGLPGQTLGDLADDILFYRDMDIDMIGMGPYVVHHNTPVGKDVMAAGMDSAEEKKRRLELGLKMIAVTRLFLPDVNIAATTASRPSIPWDGNWASKPGPTSSCPSSRSPNIAHSTSYTTTNPVSTKYRTSARTASAPV